LGSPGGRSKGRFQPGKRGGIKGTAARRGGIGEKESNKKKNKSFNVESLGDLKGARNQKQQEIKERMGAVLVRKRGRRQNEGKSTKRFGGGLRGRGHPVKTGDPAWNTGNGAER